MWHVIEWCCVTCTWSAFYLLTSIPAVVTCPLPGEEEIPEGVVGLLTPDAPDVLSHVSVRARNMHVLFATCHDEEPLKQIKDAAGQ
jgi:hypothetical protein